MKLNFNLTKKMYTYVEGEVGGEQEQQLDLCALAIFSTSFSSRQGNIVCCFFWSLLLFTSILEKMKIHAFQGDLSQKYILYIVIVHNIRYIITNYIKRRLTYKHYNSVINFYNLNWSWYDVQINRNGHRTF